MGKAEHTTKPGEKRYGKLIAIFKSPRTNVQMSKTGPHMIPIINRKVFQFSNKKFGYTRKGYHTQYISLPLHHIRPKLLRPLVFPDKTTRYLISYKQKNEG